MHEHLGTDAAVVDVQRMVTPGVDLRIRVAVDARLGPIITVGLGGVQADLIGDEVSRLAPVSPTAARRMVRNTRASAALDDEALLQVGDIMARVAQLASDHAEVAELDLNPVVVSTDGCCVVDASDHGRAGRTPGTSGPPPRRTGQLTPPARGRWVRDRVQRCEGLCAVPLAGCCPHDGGMSSTILDGNEAAARVAYALSEVSRSIRSRRRRRWARPPTPGRPQGGRNLRRRARRRRDAVGGRSRRSAARSPPGRIPRHDVHRVAGSVAHAAQHVQDRRGVDADGDPRGGQVAGDTCALDLRRPQRRHGRPDDGFRDAVRRIGAGGARFRGGRPRGDAADPGAVPPLLRRFPHLARDQPRRVARR